MKKALTTIALKSRLAKEVKVAFTLTDQLFGSFSIRKTANAWYSDRGKVERLINVFKYDPTIEEACVCAGISLDQFKYFKEQHPEFSSIIEACRQLPRMKARKTIVEALDRDLPTARWYAERKMAGEFGKQLNINPVRVDMAERTERMRERYK